MLYTKGGHADAAQVLPCHCVPVLLTVAAGMRQCHIFAKVCGNAESKAHVCHKVHNARQLKEVRDFKDTN